MKINWKDADISKPRELQDREEQMKKSKAGFISGSKRRIRKH